MVATEITGLPAFLIFCNRIGNNQINHILKSLILLIVFLFSYPEGPTDSNWVLEKSKNDIKVYTRSYANSEIQEFKAISLTTRSLGLLENLINNVEDYPEWQLNISSANILKQLDKNDLYVWYVIKLPWPFTNRDMIAHMTKSVSEGGIITYHITNAPDYIKEKENLIRIKNAEGKWRFTPMPNGEIEIYYQFYADPGGNLPEWVINMFIVDAPYQTFLNLHQRISKN